jgi:pentatricopeptide repeat protein
VFVEPWVISRLIRKFAKLSNRVVVAKLAEFFTMETDLISSLRGMLQFHSSEVDLASIKSVLQQMRDHGIQPTNIDYAVAMRGFSLKGMTSEVVDLYDDMKADDIKPSPDVFTQVLSCIRVTRNYSKLPGLIEMIEDEEVEKEHHLVTTLLSIYSDDNQLEV